MGAEAEAGMEEAMAHFNRWFKDPAPAGGYASCVPKPVDRPESEWDDSKWRKSNLRADVCMGTEFISDEESRIESCSLGIIIGHHAERQSEDAVSGESVATRTENWVAD